MAGPEKLKPRGIAAEGLRMLLPLKADETMLIIGPEAGIFNPTDADSTGSWWSFAQKHARIEGYENVHGRSTRQIAPCVVLASFDHGLRHLLDLLRGAVRPVSLRDVAA